MPETADRPAHRPAGDRRRRRGPGRPGGGLSARSGAGARSRDATRSPRGTRTARRPSCTRCAPAAGPPDTRAGRSGWCRTCTRRSSPRRRRRGRAAEPEPAGRRGQRRPRPVLVRAGDRGARGDRQLARAGGLARPSCSPRRWRRRWRYGGSGCARTRDAAYVHLIVNERREAGASLPHTHAQLYALGFVPADGRPRARALRARTPRGRWAATCSATSSRRRCAGASGSSPSTTRRC